MKNLLIILGLTLIRLSATAQPDDTDQQKSMAKQMASYMDMAWDAEPEEGMANLRILMLKDGEPLEGIISIHGRYSLVLKGKINHSTAFNPNKNGRYVYEGLQPGTYQIEITGQYEAQGFEWKGQIEFQPNSSPIIEVVTDE